MKRSCMGALLFLCALYGFASGKKNPPETESSIPAAKKQPEWITTPDTDYPADRYFAAAGSGATRSDAENDATAAIGKILNQNIEAEEKTHEAFSSDSAGLSSYLSDIRTTTSLKDISGLTIKENWTAADGTEYALAILDRSTAGQYYRNKIDGNSETVQEHIKLAQNESGTLKGCADILQAYQTAKDNDYYLELLSVIKPIYRKLVSLPYTSSAAVGNLASQLLNTVTVLVNVEGDSSGRIAGALATAVGDTGIKTVGGSSGGADDKVPYALLCTVSFDPFKMADSTYAFVRYTAKAELIESSSGKNILSWSKTGRAAKLSEEEAKQAAVRALESAVESEYGTAFNSMLQAR